MDAVLKGDALLDEPDGIRLRLKVACDDMQCGVHFRFKVLVGRLGRLGDFLQELDGVANLLLQVR